LIPAVSDRIPQMPTLNLQKLLCYLVFEAAEFQLVALMW
jgi:hypothetical protein